MKITVDPYHQGSSGGRTVGIVEKVPGVDECGRQTKYSTPSTCLTSLSLCCCDNSSTN